MTDPSTEYLGLKLRTPLLAVADHIHGISSMRWVPMAAW